MRCAVVLLTLAAACGGSAGGGNPTGDDQPLSDAGASPSDAPPPPQHGLHVTWTAMPPLPGMLRPDLTVTSASFAIQRLQVIGDNGQPMTTAPQQLGWGGEGDPEAITFGAAPSGLYSQVNIDLDGQVVGPSYEIVGTARVMGDTKNYRIRDDNSLDVDVMGYNVQLAPGGDAMLGIKLDLRDAIDAIHFEQLNEDGGYLVLGTSDPQMQAFRDKLEDAFKKGP